MTTKDFNEFRFKGLNYNKFSNKYLTMRRVNDTEDKIVVKVGDNHILTTKFGYALILDYNHVVFLKDWQVDQNYFGNEVLLDKKYFIIKEWGEHEDFFYNEENLNFDKWLEVAKLQDKAGTIVKWSI